MVVDGGDYKGEWLIDVVVWVGFVSVVEFFFEYGVDVNFWINNGCSWYVYVIDCVIIIGIIYVFSNFYMFNVR